MKTRLSFFAALLLTLLNAQGAPVSAERARGLAERFVGSHAERFTRLQRAPRAAALTLAHKAPDASYFVFNCPDSSGYVVVAGDDVMPTPVLGWADDGAFDYADAPEHVRFWFDEYARFIDYARSHPEAAPAAAPSLPSAVSPLLATRWDQKDPYNLYCPSNASGLCATGCVATAMAQVMYHYRKPAAGTGAISYSYNLDGDETQKRTLTRNFNHTLDWAAMTPTYGTSSTTASRQAVATLMADCGAAVRMVYGSTSNSNVTKIPSALVAYFGYDRGMTVHFRDGVEDVVWHNAIYNELKAGRPVITGAQSDTGGHAFIYDGCTTDGYFHVNWGWSGTSNGYFLLNDLSPNTQGTGGHSGAYRFKQTIITGIRPDAGGTAHYQVLVSDQSVSVTSAPVSSTTAIEFTIADYQPVYTAAYEFELAFGFGVFKPGVTGSVVKTFGLSSNYTYQNSYIYSSTRRVTPSSTFADLADGDYLIRPLFSAGESLYHVTMSRLSSSEYIKMTKSGGMLYFTTLSSSAATVSATPAIENKHCYTSMPVYAGATFGNTSELSYYGDVRLVLCDADYVVVSSTPVMRLDVPAGGTAQLKGELTAPSTPGTYYLLAINSQNQMLGQQLNVQVTAATPGTLSREANLTVAAPVMPANNVRGRVSIGCSGGPFIGRLLFYILDENYYIKKRVYSDVIDLTSGGTATVTISTDMRDFDTTGATTYLMGVQNPGLTSATLWGPAVRFKLGPEVNFDVNGDGRVDITDVAEVIDVVLGKKVNARADVNGDGRIDIEDVSAIINAVLGK